MPSRLRTAIIEPIMEESKGYIEIHTDREHSEPSPDSGFADLIKRLEVSDKPLADALKDFGKSPEKKRILTEALGFHGRNWIDLVDLRQNPDLAAKFSHLLTFWDFLVDGQPKTPEQHRQEAEAFAKALAE